MIMLQRNQPIHEMPIKYQELFMNSKYYSDMIKNLDIKYLNTLVQTQYQFMYHASTRW